MNHLYAVEKSETIIVSGTLLLKLLIEAKLIPPPADEDSPRGELRLTMTIPQNAVGRVGDTIVFDVELPETALHFRTMTSEIKSLRP